MAQNAVMEVYAVPKRHLDHRGDTPDGTMCLVAGGQAYETVEEQVPAKGTRI